MACLNLSLYGYGLWAAEDSATLMHRAIASLGFVVQHFHHWESPVKGSSPNILLVMHLGNISAVRKYG